MRCNRLLQRSTFGTTEKELIKGSNLRHFNGSFRAERVLIRHRLKWTRHFAHATGTVSVRVRRTEVFESPFWESLSGEQKFAITVFKPWEGRRYPQALNSFVWFLLKNSARESGSKTFCVQQDGFFAAALRISKFPLHCSIFVPKIDTGEHQLPQHKSGYLHRIKRKLRAVSPYGLFFVRFRQSRSCFKTLKFQSYARTFQVRSGICFLIPCAAFPVSLLIPPCSY